MGSVSSGLHPDPKERSDFLLFIGFGVKSTLTAFDGSLAHFRPSNWQEKTPRAGAEG